MYKNTHSIAKKCIVIGASAGGMTALAKFLPKLPSTFPHPLIIVQHLHPNQGHFHVKFYSSICKLKVKEADDKEEVLSGYIYFATPNYHLLVEEDRTFSFSIDAKVNYSRPSIDVTFESAADAFGRNVIGIILTGANHDGAIGLQTVKKMGGIAIVQTPEDAEVSSMPEAAIEKTKPDFILPLSEIAPKLRELVDENKF